MYLGKKSPTFFPAGPSFLVVQLNVYRRALILINLPCPEKFLFTRLFFYTDHLTSISNSAKWSNEENWNIWIFQQQNISEWICLSLETHFCTSNKKQWTGELQGQIQFSYGKTNSCRVTVGYYGSKTSTLINNFTDDNNRVIVIEAKIDDVIFALINNIYNPNTETEQFLKPFNVSRL